MGVSFWLRYPLTSNELIFLSSILSITFSFKLKVFVVLTLGAFLLFTLTVKLVSSSDERKKWTKYENCESEILSTFIYWSSYSNSISSNFGLKSGAIFYKWLQLNVKNT